jgi:4-oxalmesaconate hydratase
VLTCSEANDLTGCACCGPGLRFIHAAMGPGASSSFPPPVNIEAMGEPRHASAAGETIIDCHGHYTTEPKELLDWRKRQIAAIGDRSQMPTIESLKISDNSLRESVERAQLRLQRERGTSLTCFRPALRA